MSKYVKNLETILWIQQWEKFSINVVCMGYWSTVDSSRLKLLFVFFFCIVIPHKKSKKKPPPRYFSFINWNHSFVIDSNSLVSLYRDNWGINIQCHSGRKSKFEPNWVFKFYTPNFWCCCSRSIHIYKFVISINFTSKPQTFKNKKVLTETCLSVNKVTLSFIRSVVITILSDSFS